MARGRLPHPVLLAAFAMVSCLVWVEAAAARTDEDPVQRIARMGNAATVGIYCNRGAGDSYYGTGAVITIDGYILTSTTVVMEDAREIEVYFTDYTKSDAKLVEVNREMETALIKAEKEDLPFFPVADALPEVGSAAFSFGNAKNMIRLGGNATFSAGIISGLYQVKSADGQSSYAGLALETDAAINPGQDGGPLVNGRGELAGIISLSYTDLRWQGTAVPFPLIRKALKSFQNGKVKVRRASSGPSNGKSGWYSPAVRHAADALVALEVTREHPPEVLPRCSWTDMLKETDQLLPMQKARRMQSFTRIEAVLSANRQIRRPDHAVTGIAISADGLILTSLFNVADEDRVIEHKKHGLVKLDFKGELEDLFPYPDKEYKASKNKVVSITAVLKDGRRLPAKLLASHVPLGVALLKVEAEKLPFLDVKSKAKVPVPGTAAGVLGYIGGEYPYTLNTGMVCSTRRQRSLRLQFDAILNYGNSGGPVLSQDGSFYGLALHPLMPNPLSGRIFQLQELRAWRVAINSGVSHVARADKILEELPELVQGKSAKSYEGPFLGVMPDSRKLLSDTVVIGKVVKKSTAGKMGLKRGDIVLDMDGQPVKSWKDLVRLISSHEIGDTTTLRVKRGKKTLELKGVMEARP